MSREDDKTAITELMNIARIYVKHGDFEHAEKVLALVGEMQKRICPENKIADMQAWRSIFPGKEA